MSRFILFETVGTGDEALAMDTEDLVARFGIPEGSHLVIESLWSSSHGTLILQVLWDSAFNAEFNRKRGDTPSSMFDQVRSHTYSDDSNDVYTRNALTINQFLTEPYQYLLGSGFDVFNQLLIRSSSASNVTIQFRFEQGGMNFIQEIGDRFGDVKSLGPIQTSPGQSWHQVGDRLNLDPTP